MQKTEGITKQLGGGTKKLRDVLVNVLKSWNLRLWIAKH